MRHRLAPLLVLPLALAAPRVLAQNNPSADQIIQSLKPGGNLLQGDTRGIRLVNPGAGAAAPQAAAPQSATAAPSVSLSVEFASGSAELQPSARQALDALGRALSSQDLAQYRFRIEGHTDTVGTPEANKALSQRRAEAVSAYLAQKFGIAPSRLQAIGLGEEGLAVATPPQTPNARNRRVKVVNLGA
jgi:OOP family OmpA-OmpF porin